MRPFAFPLCALLLVSASRAGEPSPEPDEDNDAKTILGTWEVVKAEKDGKPLPDINHEGMKFEITKDQLVITTTGRGQKDMARYTLDTKSKPRGIDINVERLKGKTVKGIYKLEKGDLIMCWGEPGRERPTKFGDKLVLRKSKAKK